MPSETDDKCNSCSTSSWVWGLFFLVIIAIVINYLITFRIWNVRPTENFTNCDYCNQNNYYEQYQ